MRITSISNPKVKEWRSLAREAPARREAGAAWVEGARFVEAALRAGCGMMTLLHVAGKNPPLSPFAKGGKPFAPEIYEVSEAVMKKCATTASPPPVAAVISVPSAPKGVPREGKYAFLCGMQNPGNVGAIVRSAHGAGWRGAVLCGACADPFSPKAIRASAGSVFFMEIRHESAATLAAWREKGARVFAADAREGSADFAALKGLLFGGVVIGSESHGIPQDMAALCEGKMRIPLSKDCESLNAAQAAAVLMFARGK